MSLPPLLRIHLLGEFAVFAGEPATPVTLRPRQQALLAYLLLHRHTPQPRQQIAFTFWPDSTEAQAFTNLRKLFYQLRRALPQGARLLQADSRYLAWNSTAFHTLDVAELEAALDELEDMTAPAPDAIARVAALYGGELAPGCYDDWILPLRSRLHAHVLNALEHAAIGLTAQGETRAGLGASEHLVRLDPLHEAGYRHVMRGRALLGDRAGALHTYHECVARLQKELEVSPSQATQALYHQILSQATLAGGSPEQAEPASLHTRETPGSVEPPATGAIPLMGRSDEWTHLQDAWQRAARSRQAHMVALRGEAGIGKTRLADELALWAERRSLQVVRARSYGAGGALAYAPVIQLLRRATTDHKLAQLDDVWLEEVGRLLPEALATRSHLQRLPPISERGQRGRFFEALARGLLAGDQPLLVVVDDLQWCDAETLEWLAFLLRFEARQPLLLVGTVRDDELEPAHPYHALEQDLAHTGQVTALDLTPLNETDVATLAGHITGQALSPAQAAQLYRDTEGNPLFVVEMAHGFGEVTDEASANDSADGVKTDGRAVALPAKVYQVLRARLRQLSWSAQEIAGLASVLGRSFTYAVLAAMSDQDERALVQALDELWRRRIVREQSAGAYDFSHDRLRDVAYAELSGTRRRLLHRQGAQALETIFGDNLGQVAGELAHHHEQAGNLTAAVEYLAQAADVARAVAAYPEAVMRLRKALALLETAPFTEEEAMRQELGVLVRLGPCLVALHGYANLEVEVVYRRAHQLCTQLGDDPKLMPTLIGLSLFYMIRGEIKQSLAICRQGLELAQHSQDDDLLLEAHLVLGSALKYLGEFQASLPHLEQVLLLHEPNRHRTHADIYGHEPGVVAHVALALSLWYLGYADRSLRLLERGLALAYGASHPYTLNLAQVYASVLYYLRREPNTAQAVASAGVELAHHQGFYYWRMICTMLEGWATLGPHSDRRISAIHVEEILTQMGEAFVGFRATGTGLLASFYMGVLVQAHVAVQAFDAGWTKLNEALALASASEDKFYLPELHRLHGELLLAQGETSQPPPALIAQAEAAFFEAIHIAQEQEARMLELRATTSLAHLWTRQGKHAEAHARLAAIYAWFTEGFDTVDLRQAASLLDELRHCETGGPAKS